MLRRRWPLAVALAALAAVACSGGTTDDEVVDVTAGAGSEAPAVLVPEDGVGPTTAVPLDGNRWIEGVSDLAVRPYRFGVNGTPQWIVGAATADGGTVWAVALRDGSVRGLTLVDGVAGATSAFAGARVTPDAPPVLVPSDGRWRLLSVPDDASTISSPLPLPDGRVAYVSRTGELVVTGPAGEERLDLDLLRDTRLSLDGVDTIVALARPTDEYGHGVLGDGLEASAILDVSVDGAATVVDETPVSVIEGTSVILADLIGDAARERLVTVSDDRSGAKVVAYNRDGETASDAIGQGGRWRHVIGVLPGPDGPEVVEVVTPHLGRRLQFLTAGGEFRLDVLAARDGVSASHAIGSRNLDEALLIDAGTGPAFVGPTVDRDALVIARREGSDVVLDEEVDLGGRVATNLGWARRSDGRVELAVGLEDGTVLIWSPRA